MTARPVPLAVATAGAAMAAAYAAARVFGAVHVGRMLPWVLGRGLGIAGYLSLVALTALGLWLRHPWRLRWRWPAVEAQVRLHAALAAVTLVLVLGHVIALALDTYAGVGWKGAVVPGAASYRPVAVGLGTAGVYLGLLIGASAALAGRVTGRAWLPIHRLAVVAFAVVWLHGVVAGIDTGRLAPLYVGTGGLVIALAVSRRLARSPAPDAVGGLA